MGGAHKYLGDILLKSECALEYACRDVLMFFVINAILVVRGRGAHNLLGVILLKSGCTLEYACRDIIMMSVINAILVVRGGGGS